MPQIYMPTLLFWENGNAWYGSDGAARFYVKPMRPGDGEEEKTPRLEAELWRGPLEKERSEILETASFPLDEAGLSQLTEWLEEQADKLNG